MNNELRIDNVENLTRAMSHAHSELRPGGKLCAAMPGGGSACVVMPGTEL